MRSIDTLIIENADLSVLEPYKIDCQNCCGLCCVALFFSKTEGFPENKERGKPCKNLKENYQCQVHKKLHKQGLKGCMAYDCFGAGQKITAKLPQKPNWQTDSKEASAIIFDAYLILLQIHQTLWYLGQASIMRLPQSQKDQIQRLQEEGIQLSEKPIEAFQTLDIEPFRDKANQLLKEICKETAARLKQKNKDDGNKNYLGKNLKQKKLMGADFSMALLIAANLEQANLFGTNFLGADMRDTNIQNTDLTNSLFLTQIQIGGAKGNGQTRLPAYLDQPAFWE